MQTQIFCGSTSDGHDRSDTPSATYNSDASVPVEGLSFTRMFSCMLAALGFQLVWIVCASSSHSCAHSFVWMILGCEGQLGTVSMYVADLTFSAFLLVVMFWK